MATHFNIPKSPEIQIYQNDTFLGADFTTDVANVDDTRSPEVVNMIRSIPGKVRKRMGYELASRVTGLSNNTIYGVFHYKYADVWLLHVGNRLYQFKGGAETYWVDHNANEMGTEDYYDILFDQKTYETRTDMKLLYTGMAERRSTALELNQMLIILDGKKMLYVTWQSGSKYLTCGKMEDYPKKTVPLVRFSCDPDTGAGTDYQPFNLLSPRFEQDFLISTTGKKKLQLYTDRLKSGTGNGVEVQFLQNDGTWVKKTEGTDFWVDYGKGTVNFGTVTTYDEISSVAASGYPADYTVTLSRQQTGAARFIVRYTVTVENPDPNEPALAVIDPVEFVISVTTAGGQTYSKTIAAAEQPTKSGDMVLFSVSTKSPTNPGAISPDDKMHWGDNDYWNGGKSYYSGSISFEEECRKVVTYSDLPQTPVTGQDNVKVFATYEPTSSGMDIINHCRFGILFGVNGESDRLFVSGNEDKGDNLNENGAPSGTTYSLRNRDWYSAQYDPTYFPDTGYSLIGSDASAITGYAVVNSYLATFKDSNEMSQTVFIREGDLYSFDLDGDGNEETQPTFKLINTLQGVGTLSNYTIDYFQTEPVFLSKLGICALTAQDITGERYAQVRSYYLNKKLLAEKNLSEAIGFTYKDYYVVVVNNHFYILDGIQPVRTDKSEPYATRQYVSFYFELNHLAAGETITCAWEMYGRFYFGTNQGRIFRFFKDEKDLLSYNDAGQPIEAVWQTPDISGRLFYKNKTFRYVALKVSPARNSSILIEGEKNGVWEEIKEEYAKTKYFSFIDLTFARTPTGKPKFTFMCDKTQKVITTKTRIKKIDKVQFRFSNSEVNEPLGLNNFALEYTQGGNLK